MSGFAAVWNTDGAPVDEALLTKMRNFLSLRGPDEQRFVVLGDKKNVGLVHAAFHTAPESRRESQPCSIDGAVWLTGHLRIDARKQLSKDLCSQDLGHGAPTDAQMILQAYKVWGRNFVDRIIGDYSFVIWDEREQRIFAVRDHLGTRPLFYGRSGQCWIFSNTLDCVRLHPGVSGELDDIWLTRFLANLRRTEFERTAYREIKRLPPGHVFDLIPTGGRARKYWQLAVGEPIYYKRHEQYCEHFRDLAKTVIGDRIRMTGVGVGMSGGLDSTSIVAFILQAVKDKAKDIVVSSTYFESLINDDERRYAQAAADHFGISVHFENMDNKTYDPRWWTRSSVPPEPHDGVLSQFVRWDPAQPGPFDKVRVVFIGHGPDDALDYMDWKPYLRWLLKTGRFNKFVFALHSRLTARPLAEIFSSLRAAIRSDQTFSDSENPAWLRGDVLDSCNEDPSDQWNISAQRHPWHPIAVAHFSGPAWQDYFDSFDPGFGGRLLEAVHPYLDVRMVKFLLSLPVVPWCHRKLIMRESLYGLLPEAVLTRKKKPLSEDPWVKAMAQHAFPPILKSPELSRYVDMSKIPIQWTGDREQNRMIARFLSFQYWLAARDRQSTSTLSLRSQGSCEAEAAPA